MASETFVRIAFGILAFGLIMLGFAWVISWDMNNFPALQQTFWPLLAFSIVVIVISLFLFKAAKKF